MSTFCLACALLGEERNHDAVGRVRTNAGEVSDDVHRWRLSGQPIAPSAPPTEM
jgi:hypothetical protein